MVLSDFVIQQEEDSVTLKMTYLISAQVMTYLIVHGRNREYQWATTIFRFLVQGEVGRGISSKVLNGVELFGYQYHGLSVMIMANVFSI